MTFLRTIACAALAVLAGCGSPVPDGMYLTLSVSAQDVAVEGAVNGKANEFISGDSGNMAGSMPLNKFVREGENEASFTLAPVVHEGRETDPAFRAALEISLTGDVVDTQRTGERVMFERSLTPEETATLAAGGAVTVRETFTVDPGALRAMTE